MKKIYGYALAAAMLSLASCSSDAPEVNDNKVIEGPVVGYVKMNLPAGTRAADGKYYVTFYSGTSKVNATLVGEITNGAAEYALSAIPDKVVVFKDADLAESTTATTDNKDAKTPAVDGNNSYGSTIALANIYHTQGAATTAQVVNVYLDYTVAQVTIDASSATTNVTSKLSDYTVSFTPEYVFVNGVATKTPIIKSLPSDYATANYGYEETDGSAKGSHWTSTDYAWDDSNGAVKHYSLTGTDAATKANKQENEMIFERALQSNATAKKHATHVIVAGKYELTGDKSKAPADWDGTFYVYGADANGNGYVFFTEADVVAAMHSTGSLTMEVTTTGGMHTHMKAANGETCLKYDKGYVYYAEPIVTKIGNTTFGKGVVRNHEYKITVSEISGWGSAIPDTDEPIIPEDGPKDADKNFVKLNIVVNPMVKVADQDIKW